MKIFAKMQHIKVSPYAMNVEYLRELFIRLKNAGFDTVFIEYDENFPYPDFPELNGEVAYSTEEAAMIDVYANESGLKVIPKCFSFSHSGIVTDKAKYKRLKDGSGMNLLSPESLELIINGVDNLLAIHPRAEIIHLGGDEIGRLGGAPDTSEFIVRHGASRLYVQFVNKLAAACRKRGVRAAIWSDVLIRHPEAVDELDRDVFIFYWDYWSYAERIHFLTIGGGLTDTFILDRSKLPADLENLYRLSIVRDKSEMPVGHLERFARYWELDETRSSSKGFAYFKWLSECGFDVVASMLPYPEKGSFLTNMDDKVVHARTFLREMERNSGFGFLACCWQPYWLPVAGIWPGLLLTMEMSRDLNIGSTAMYERAAAAMGDCWTGEALREYCSIGRHFEFSDILNPFWSQTEIKTRVEWLSKAGWLEEDNWKAASVDEKGDAFLDKWGNAIGDCIEKHFVEDLRWRAQCQLFCSGFSGFRRNGLLEEGRRLRAVFELHADRWFKPGSAGQCVDFRFKQWLEAVETMRLSTNIG